MSIGEGVPKGVRLVADRGSWPYNYGKNKKGYSLLTITFLAGYHGQANSAGMNE